MGKDNRICYLCGEKYSYCPTCSEDTFKPSWYSMWCSEYCKDVDQILAAHTVKVISIEEAKQKLLDLNLDFDKMKMNNDIREHLNEILSFEQIKVKTADNLLRDKSKPNSSVKKSYHQNKTRKK